MDSIQPQHRHADSYRHEKVTSSRFAARLIAVTTMWFLRTLSIVSHQGPMTKRHRELDLERKWELYRLDVVERMRDSAYKTAVLAGIAHKLKMLDRMEASSLG